MRRQKWALLSVGSFGMGASYYLLGCLALASLALPSPSSSGSKFTIVRNRSETSKQLRSWDLVITRVTYPYVNPDYLGPMTQVTLEGPETFSFTIDLLQTLPSNVKSVYQSYERNNRNEYIPSLKHTDSPCGELQKEMQGVPMFKCNHFVNAGITECPFKKGLYSAKSIKCSSSDGPVVAPGHHWRINHTWYTNNNILIWNRLVDFTIIQKNRIG